MEDIDDLIQQDSREPFREPTENEEDLEEIYREEEAYENHEYQSCEIPNCSICRGIYEASRDSREGYSSEEQIEKEWQYRE